MENVIEWLQILFSTSQTVTAQQRRDSSKYLEQFQKTVNLNNKPEAWTVVNSLIRHPDSTLEMRLFATQTFRQKIEFDIVDLNESQQQALYPF